eukprot:TRINITY_DN4104_c1_g1_i2.p1 TRINITY_DN4104_c1_g1~~TRINITY_DN4104_c1_g1_i2.p1  ORF type:complete len:227 (+),score=128.60 TRINITY_DN4104_c1_g1_i2:97-777(+)
MAPKKNASKPAAKKAEPKKAEKTEAKPAKAAAATDGKGVYVKNLNFPGIAHDTIIAAFKPCGEVKDVVLRRRKYCIVYFKDAAGASKAKELNGKVLKGQKVTVESAKKKLPQERSEFCTTVFVGDLPRMSRKQGKANLKKEFSSCGAISKVRTYQAGHGFVYFKDNASAKKAVTDMDNKPLGKPFPENRPVKVRYSIRTKEKDAAKEKVRKTRIAAKAKKTTTKKN